MKLSNKRFTGFRDYVRERFDAWGKWKAYIEKRIAKLEHPDSALLPFWDLNQKCCKCGSPNDARGGSIDLETGEYTCYGCQVKADSAPKESVPVESCIRCSKIEKILDRRIHGRMPNCQCGICCDIVDLIWPDEEINDDPAPECTCIKYPVSGGQYSAQAILESRQNCSIHGEKHPAPPLNARVAIACGKTLSVGGHGQYRIVSADYSELWGLVPPYDTDVALIKPEFERFCDDNNLIPQIRYGKGVWEITEGREITKASTLELAMCYFIVAYAEGK